MKVEDDTYYLPCFAEAEGCALETVVVLNAISCAAGGTSYDYGSFKETSTSANIPAGRRLKRNNCVFKYL